MRRQCLTEGHEGTVEADARAYEVRRLCPRRNCKPKDDDYVVNSENDARYMCIALTKPTKTPSKTATLNKRMSSVWNCLASSWQTRNGTVGVDRDGNRGSQQQLVGTKPLRFNSLEGRRYGGRQYHKHHMSPPHYRQRAIVGPSARVAAMWVMTYDGATRR